MLNEELQKLKNAYPELFKKVPPRLIELAISEETASNITEICLKSGIENEEKIEKIAYRIVLALLGQIPMKNLPLILEKGVKLNSETARKISTGINQLIFPQIKKTQPAQPIKPFPPAEEKPKKPPEKDVYREQAE